MAAHTLNSYVWVVSSGKAGVDLRGSPAPDQPGRMGGMIGTEMGSDSETSSFLLSDLEFKLKLDFKLAPA